MYFIKFIVTFCYLKGVNSGVMLMNLTRMRQVNWIDKMMAYYTEYSMTITWGDQDLVNIFFHFYPGECNQSENVK